VKFRPEKNDLVQTCVDYLGRPEARRRIATAGFELMSRRDSREYLRPLLDDAATDNEIQPTSIVHKE
jgi:hypothetical protein